MVTLEYKIRMPLDLQMFAKEGPGGEKTEDATSKKLEDVRKEGNVAKSFNLRLRQSRCNPNLAK